MARLRMTGANRSVETTHVTGVLVDPNNTNWVVVIQNTAGETVFSARGSDAVARFFPLKDSWVGCNVTTSTNITAVYIYS